MDAKTLEQYFIEDYEAMRTKCEEQDRILQELQSAKFGFGITDLHRKYQAVKGSACSRWVIRDYMLKNGKVTPDRIREIIAMDDQSLFRKFRNKQIGYYSAIEYEEHEFQYTLHVRESRDEWVAITDGEKGSSLIDIPTPRELGEEPVTNTWYPIEEAQAVQDMLARALRENMEEALDEYEEEQRKKAEEGSDDGGE